MSFRQSESTTCARRRVSERARFACGLLAAWAIAIALAPPLAAQVVPFGKNKVQYTDFEWQVLSGPHVDVYYYPEEEELARAALAYAEESYDTLTGLFRHRPFRRIPMFIFSSHQHFEQTNITPSFIPEGVAGFTEFLKRRVALPFNGSYADFRHTIRHELVHFFQLSKLSRTFEQYPGLRAPFIPLWWSEGLAERWSSSQDSDDHMFNRDLVLDGKAPTLEALTYSASFAAYPLGGQIHEYLGERFGYNRVADLYENLWKYSSFEEAFAGVYGVPLKQVSQEWRYELEKTYFPMYSDRRPLRVGTRPLLQKSLANFKPSVYQPPEGPVEVFFMSPRTGYTAIYRMPIGGGDWDAERVVQGDKSEEFESLHFFDSRLDVSASGKLVFVSKYLEKDAIFIWDLEKGRIVGRYQFENIVSLSSPSWSPDGKKVVFIGLRTNGPSDLFVLDFEKQDHYPLTDDRYLETDPDWSPDGRYIVFSSDRTPTGNRGDENLFLYDLETGQTTFLTYGPWKDLDPRWSPDGRYVAFTSDRTGVYDVFLVDREGRGGRLTNFTGAAFDVDWLPDGSALVFSGFEKGTFNIYYMSLTPYRSDEGFELADRFETPSSGLAQGWVWEELDRPVLAEARKEEYRTSFGLDFAAGEAVFAPGYGNAQGVSFLMSDLLGNHLIYFGLASQQFGSFSDLVGSFSGQVLYYNLSRRVNWGVGAYRFKGRFVDQAFRNLYREESVGGLFVAAYPFSKFRRLELQTVLEYSDRVDAGRFFSVGAVDLFVDTLSLTRQGIIGTNLVSYIKDNTLWLPTGPIDGVRWNFTGGLVTDLSRARVENYSLMFDMRRYLRTSLRSAYAVRLFGFYSDGAIPSRIAFGGSNSLRLYPYLGLFGSRAFMLNQELRFPILQALGLAFPFGTMVFPGIQGALFVDMASIWLEDRDPQGVWGSFGASFRMAVIFPLILRLDVGRRFVIGDLPTRGFRDFYGTEVDFFFGFNY